MNFSQQENATQNWYPAGDTSCLFRAILGFSKSASLANTPTNRFRVMFRGSCKQSIKITLLKSKVLKKHWVTPYLVFSDIIVVRCCDHNNLFHIFLVNISNKFDKACRFSFYVQQSNVLHASFESVIIALLFILFYMCVVRLVLMLQPMLLKILGKLLVKGKLRSHKWSREFII